MTTKYQNFSTTTQGGQEYIIAQPKNDRDEPVRIPGAIGNTEDPDETWTDVVGQLVQYDISNALNLESGKGKIQRDDALNSLIASEDKTIPIESEAQAEAVIDYFVDEDVLDTDGTDLVVLEDPSMLQDIGSENDETKPKMLLNWVSAIEGCTNKIDDTIETIEQTEQELREEIGESNAAEKVQEFDHKQQEVAQELMNLTNGRQLDETDLSPPDQAEYERLEERLFHLESMKEAAEGGTLEDELRRAAEELGAQMQKLEEIDDVLKTQKQRVKRAYKYKEEIAPERAMEMAKNLSNLATSLTDVDSAAEKKEEQNTMEKVQQVLDATEDIDAEEMSTDAEADEETGSYEFNN
ncbi:hypothetical protein HZS55_04285 [Halosimplex rubrum]|uniref:Uncharacterized protein n=1 Tax=Halosimplex rubrum TaxID=869889 RepID=A0A7D5T348_9EURY|nr:hypothetical protein [Halosimplex rubrum]QLH76570.1 hypothetical protein HZS55_04285 [Halosimplex rubrum]